LKSKLKDVHAAPTLHAEKRGKKKKKKRKKRIEEKMRLAGRIFFMSQQQDVEPISEDCCG
jgi:hypothetical protein